MAGAVAVGAGVTWGATKLWDAMPDEWTVLMTNALAAKELRDPFRSAGRIGVAALLLWAMLSALAMTAIGVGAALQGYRSGWSALVFGCVLILVCVLTGANLRAPRGPGGRAVPDGDEIALPLRSGFALRQGLVLIALSSLGLPMAGLENTPVAWILALGLLGLGVCGAAWLMGPGARKARVHLSPEEIVVPQGLGTTNRIAWREVESVEVVPSWQPHVVIHAKSGDGVALRLLPQSWSAESLSTLITHFAGKAGRRAELTSPDAVEPFRN